MALLDVEHVSVSFGGVQALRHVDLDVVEGMVTGLIGPNGAGKTTLFNVICGLQAPDQGRVVLDGRDISGIKAHRRARLGLARTFQRLEVFGSLSVRENVLVAAEMRRRWDRRAPAPRTIAAEVIEQVGITHLVDERVDELPTGLARLTELARALVGQPRVLLLDEPSSGLDDEETHQFSQLLTDLASRGLAVLLVEHDVALVMGVCSRIHVLDFGQILAVGSPKDIQQNRDVQAAYLGSVPIGPDAA